MDLICEMRLVQDQVDEIKEKLAKLTERIEQLELAQKKAVLQPDGTSSPRLPLSSSITAMNPVLRPMQSFSRPVSTSQKDTRSLLQRMRLKK